MEGFENKYQKVKSPNAFCAINDIDKCVQAKMHERDRKRIMRLIKWKRDVNMELILYGYTPCVWS